MGKVDKTVKEYEQFCRMRIALKRITLYQTPDQLRRRSQKDWGLDYQESLGMSYENIQQEAKNALRGVRFPKQIPIEKPTP